MKIMGDIMHVRRGLACRIYKDRLTFIDEYKTEIISRRVFLIHFSECGGQVEATEEEPYRYSLS